MVKLNNIINVFKNNNLTNNEKLVLLYFLSLIEDNFDSVITESNDDISINCNITGRTASTVVKSLIDKGIIKAEYFGHFRKIKIIR